MNSVKRRASGCYWKHELSQKTFKPFTPPPAKPNLNVGVNQQAHATIVKLRSRLDSSMDRELLIQFRKLISQGQVSIIVDAKKLEYLNSSGVSAFIAVIDDVRGSGGDLKFVGLNRQCAFVLDRLGLSEMIQSFDSIEDAVTAFETPIEDFLTAGSLDLFVAGKNSKVFHSSRCSSAKRLQSRHEYTSRKAARKDGLRPCRRCLLEPSPSP